MQADKATTLREIREEVADLMAASWQKILGEKMTKGTDEKLIAKAIKETK